MNKGIKAVKRMSSPANMTLAQLYIAAEFEKFAIADLAKRAGEVAESSELETILEHLASFEDDAGTGAWYNRPATIR